MRLLSLTVCALLLGCTEGGFEADQDGGTSGGAAGSGGASGGGAVSGSGGGSGTGGNASGGAGGGEGRCVGRPCGAICSSCPPGQSCPDVVMYCDADGGCGLAFPVCEEPSCESSADCAVPELCQVCADGTTVCPSAVCVDGQCVSSLPTCPDSCTTDQDCPQIRAACQICPDGSAACPYSRCEGGQCVSGFDSCGDYEPCAGKSCGETCSPCDPSDPMCAAPAVVMYCDAAGACGLNTPKCESCEDVQCLRAYECVRECGGVPEYVGCCPCEPPLFDNLQCTD